VQPKITGHEKNHDDDADDGEDVHCAAPLDPICPTATLRAIERRRQVRKLLSVRRQGGYDDDPARMLAISFRNTAGTARRRAWFSPGCRSPAAPGLPDRALGSAESDDPPRAYPLIDKRHRKSHDSRAIIVVADELKAAFLKNSKARETSMKCPSCNTDLVLIKRDGIAMESCPSCKGMWLSRQELEQLEDEAFDLGDDKKGSLMLEAIDDSAHQCPQCSQPMRTFDYREYDLALDFCGAGHGFWLNADDDKKVLALMKKEEAGLGRKVRAEQKWAGHLRWMRSGSFLDKIKDWWN